VRVDTYVGQRAPAHCSATGKVILAFRPGPPLASTAPLTRYTSATIDDPAALARELALVRQRGYAVNQEEWRRGVCAIAMPLRGEGGAVVASVSLTMPTDRFARNGSPRRLLKPLGRAAAAISARLGDAGRVA
jgi:DNA-binding IclR family transcriptional regulator